MRIDLRRIGHHFVRQSISSILLGSACLAGAQSSTSTLQPYVIDHRGATASPADLEFLNDRPAGKYGFISIKNGHLVTPRGRRIRFWGVHITAQSPGSIELPPKADATMYARTLARFGANIVRLHFLDTAAPVGISSNDDNSSRSFDRQQLDRLDFLASELKKNGIYMDLNLNVERKYKAGDGVADASVIGVAKSLTLYDKRLIELQKEYAKKLLTHVNPYTGKDYLHEPAIALVEVTNENAIVQGYRPPTKFYADELDGIFNQWLKQKLTSRQLRTLRQEAGVIDNQPIPRLTPNATLRASKFRYETEVQFFMDLEGRFYADMRAYLRNLGVKQPLIGSSDHWHFGSPYPALVNLAKFDIVDGHDYWYGPGPEVNDPLDSTIVRLSRTAVAGRPFTVSETNHLFPDDHICEGIPIMAAYAGLQDWDMAIMYTFEPKASADWAPYIGNPYDISLDPVRMTNFAAGALIFRQFDVAQARQVVERSYSKTQVLDSGLLPGAVRSPSGGDGLPDIRLAAGAPSERPYFTPGFPLQLPLQHRVRILSFDGPPTASYVAPAANPIVSDTGQISWDTTHSKAGIVTVETDRSEALIGFVKANEKSLNHLRARVANEFAAILLTSMDDSPIATSGKMLLNTTSRVVNTDQERADLPTLAASLGVRGHSPTLIEPVTGVITLRGLQRAIAVSALALDGAGRPIGPPLDAVSKGGGNWELKVGTPTTSWYVISVEHKQRKGDASSHN